MGLHHSVTLEGRIKTLTCCVCAWLHIVASDDYPYTVMDHKLMVSWHSYLPNDREFNGVEFAHRHQLQIFIPEDWYTLVEKTRHENPFTVMRIAASDCHLINNLTSPTGKEMLMEARSNG